MNKILIFGVVALLAAVSVFSPAQAGHGGEEKWYTGTGGGLFILCLRDEGQCYGGATFSADRDQIHEGTFFVGVYDDLFGHSIGGFYRIITENGSGELISFCSVFDGEAPDDIVGLDVFVTADCEGIPTTGTIELVQ